MQCKFCKPFASDLRYFVWGFALLSRIQAPLHDHPLVIVSFHANTKKKRFNLLLLIYYSDMSTQVNKSANRRTLARRNNGKIRNYLDQPNAEKIVRAFVTSKLDFCNTLLYGLSKKQLEKLQRILNAAARIKKTKKFQHISPVLRNLHWLPVTKRIEFKILTITYKALNGMAPSYISDLRQVRHPNRNLLHGSALLVYHW